VVSAGAVNVSGKPMMVGGAVVKAAGCATLVLSAGVASLVGFLFSFGGWWWWWIPGLLFFLATSPFSLGLFFGGQLLSKSGKESQDSARVRAIVAMAQARGGAVTLPEVVEAIRAPAAEAQAMLDRLVRFGEGDARTRRSGSEPLLRLEVDDDGTVFYALPGPLRRGRWEQGGALGERTRGPGVRVAPAPPVAPPASADDELEASDEAEAEREAAQAPKRAKKRR
jgi:hypothetical protein